MEIKVGSFLDIYRFGTGLEAKIEIFSNVEFSKVSLLTGIVKITLKVSVLCIVISFSLISFLDFQTFVCVCVVDPSRMHSSQDVKQVRCNRSVRLHLLARN